MIIGRLIPARLDQSDEGYEKLGFGKLKGLYDEEDSLSESSDQNIGSNDDSTAKIEEKDNSDSENTEDNQN